MAAVESSFATTDHTLSAGRRAVAAGGWGGRHLQIQAPHPIIEATADLPARNDRRGMTPKRRTPAHPEPVATKQVIIFVTVCTARRKRILANPAAVATLHRAWRDADDWAVGRYVIMPDHLHLCCSRCATT